MTQHTIYLIPAFACFCVFWRICNKEEVTKLGAMCMIAAYVAAALFVLLPLGVV